MALLGLPGAFVAGVGLGAAGLSALFHAVRRSGALKTERELSWLLTLATCVAASAGSMWYAVPAVYYSRGVADLTLTDTPSLALMGVFTAYLLCDLALGSVYYRSAIGLVTGYLHHALYTGITVFAARHGVSAIFCLLLYNEIPTIILAAGSMRRRWRSDVLFAAAFCATRIVLHAVLMAQFYMHSGHRCLWRLMLLVYPMHIHWFCSALRSTIRRRAPARLPLDHKPIPLETSVLI
ncbi:hypothetical protein H4R18_005681 [Coemansia javaensis]|uniref:TLC domain-containing protein n=1 Tax=Coemansia javaensis TaxID=2761396 RepID=A0A9W8LEG3_9FUNG|nr:hypothetical protein H4R18_005681 [Coemansia javaensis]